MQNADSMGVESIRTDEKGCEIWCQETATSALGANGANGSNGGNGGNGRSTE